ncbi:MAG: phosphoribosyl-AMP cyclohydrolase [Pseudomonadota bacterium]
MKNIAVLTVATVLIGFSGAAQATGTSSPLTEKQVMELKTAWGQGIVKIGKAHKKGGDYKAAAREHIKRFYAYGEKTVLFKPTLASKDQFRGTFDEALSYFVGGKLAEDKGFAIAPYTAVRWEPEGTTINGSTALAMGNYYFKKTDGSEVKVEYTFGINKMDNGELKIILHHSSLPFVPTT